jgi:stage II sporulation protein AA (anti-sigma F factor antagonist)
MTDEILVAFRVEAEGNDPRSFRLMGELDLNGLDQIAGALSDLEGDGDVELDLSNLAFIDSSGIGAIVRLCRMFEDRGRVLLLRPRPNVRRVLDLVGLSRFPNLIMIPRDEVLPAPPA